MRPSGWKGVGAMTYTPFASLVSFILALRYSSKPETQRTQRSTESTEENP